VPLMVVAGLAIEDTTRSGTRPSSFVRAGAVGVVDALTDIVLYSEELVETLSAPGNDQPRWDRVESGWVLRWTAAEFLVPADGMSVKARVLPGVPDDIIEHLVADHIVPRLLILRGRTVFHGTAVSIEGRAAAFLGSTGAGKSTLAVTCASAFGSLLADDCLVIDEATDPPCVIPTSAVGRLRADTVSMTRDRAVASCAGKSLIACEGASGSVPLVAIVVLDRGDPHDDIRLTRVRPASATMALSRHRYAAEDDAAGAARVLAAQRALVEAVPVWSLRYPTDLAALPAVHQVVRDLLRADPSSNFASGGCDG
jgi:hypothetical protein